MTHLPNGFSESVFGHLSSGQSLVTKNPLCRLMHLRYLMLDSCHPDEIRPVGGGLLITNAAEPRPPVPMSSTRPPVHTDTPEGEDQAGCDRGLGKICKNQSLSAHASALHLHTHPHPSPMAHSHANALSTEAAQKHMAQRHHLSTYFLVC